MFGSFGNIQFFFMPCRDGVSEGQYPQVLYVANTSFLLMTRSMPECALRLDVCSRVHTKRVKL